MKKTTVITVGLGAALATSEDPAVVDVGTAVLGIGLAQAVGLFTTERPAKPAPAVVARASVIQLNDNAIMEAIR